MQEFEFVNILHWIEIKPVHCVFCQIVQRWWGDAKLDYSTFKKITLRIKYHEFINYKRLSNIKRLVHIFSICTLFCHSGKPKSVHNYKLKTFLNLESYQGDQESWSASLRFPRYCRKTDSQCTIPSQDSCTNQRWSQGLQGLLEEWARQSTTACSQGIIWLLGVHGRWNRGEGWYLSPQKIFRGASRPPPSPINYDHKMIDVILWTSDL